MKSGSLFIFISLSLVLVMSLGVVSAVDIPCIGTINNCDTFDYIDCPTSISCFKSPSCVGEVSFYNLCNRAKTATCNSLYYIDTSGDSIWPCESGLGGDCVPKAGIVPLDKVDCSVVSPSSPCDPNSYVSAPISGCVITEECKARDWVNYECSQFNNNADSCRAFKSSGCSVQCTDSDVTAEYSDGVNYDTKGTCVDSTSDWEDYCYSPDALIEYKCGYGGNCVTDGRIPPTGSICLGGVFCLDADADGSCDVVLLTAKFTATQIPDSLRVVFNAGESIKDIEDISSYSWNFGDDSSDGTGEIVGHNYAEAKTYTVKLTITDAGDNTDDETKSVTVSAAPTGIGDGGECTEEVSYDCSDNFYNKGYCESYEECYWKDDDGECKKRPCITWNDEPVTCGAVGCTWSGGDGDGVVSAGPSCDVDSDRDLDELPLGQRQKGSDDVLYYCSLGLSWQAAKPTYDINCGDDECTDTESEATCISNYECISNSCADGLCFSVREELSAQRNFIYKIWCMVSNMISFIGEDYGTLVDADEKYCGCLYNLDSTDEGRCVGE